MKKVISKLSPRNAVVALATVAVAMLATTASAQVGAPIDTTAAVGQIDIAAVVITAVGSAILGLAGLSLAFRWGKATFF